MPSKRNVVKNFRLAAKAFIVKDNKLLILKRNYNNPQKPGEWEIPGGRLEPGEDPWTGVVRETREETALKVKPLIPLNIRHFTRDDNQTITMIIFLCKPLTSKVTLSPEHTDYKWIPLKSAKSKLGSFFHQEIEIYNKLHLSPLIQNDSLHFI